MLVKNFCKTGICILTVLALSTACTSRIDRTQAGLEVLLDSLKSEFVPDPRLEYWDISLVNIDNRLVLEGALASKKAYKAVVSSIDALFPSVDNHLVLLPEEGDGRLVNGLVNNSVTHLRREPSSRAEMVSQALLGTPVRILKEEEEKRLIQLPDGYFGWINVNEVHFMNAEELVRYRDTPKIVFHSHYGKAYSEPEESSMPVADLVAGCMLLALSEKGAFYQVEYPDGRLAWVKKEEARPAKAFFNQNPTGSGVIATALAYNGIPYLWGGVSSKNLDCSGLVSNVFFMNGIQMPRDADQQSLCGREISTSYVSDGLEAGDLLFFGRKARAGEKERVTHVGLYMGDGEFIHASGYRDRVGINSMDSSQLHFIDSYPDIFVRATRIIGEEYNGFLPLAENLYYKEILNVPQ